MSDIYEQLAEFLDELPAGFPRTTDGIELRLLRKLFTPDEARLALHLTLLDESPAVVALRAGIEVNRAAQMLAEMERKGLISANHLAGDPARYSASQFVVGFWEDQVDQLDREIAEIFEEYGPQYINQSYWQTLPQLRTIPVKESIPVTPEVMPYDQAEAIVQANADFAVRNCVCRQQQRMLDHDCGKPLETCLSFGNAALNSVASGKGRSITRTEALEILRLADRAGLVLQPANTKNPAFICACCGCCCGILRNIKLHPKPSSIIVNTYSARYQPELCIDCGACLERCQMQALTQGDSGMQFNPDRCIGCGLCVSTCPSGAMSLVRKPENELPRIPKNMAELYIRLGQQRHKLGALKIIGIALKATFDRMMAPSRD